MFRNYPALAPSSVNNMMCLFPCRPVRLAAISGPERSLSWGGNKLVAERAGVCHFWFAQGGQRAPTCAPLSHIPDWITRRTKRVSARQRDKIAVRAPTHRDENQPLCPLGEKAGDQIEGQWTEILQVKENFTQMFLIREWWSKSSCVLTWSSQNFGSTKKKNLRQGTPGKTYNTLNIRLITFSITAQGLSHFSYCVVLYQYLILHLKYLKTTNGIVALDTPGALPIKRLWWRHTFMQGGWMNRCIVWQCVKYGTPLQSTICLIEDVS